MVLYPEKEGKLKKRKKHSAKPAKPAKKEVSKKEPVSAAPVAQKDVPKSTSSASPLNKKLILFLIAAVVIVLASALLILNGTGKSKSSSDQNEKPDIIKEMETQPTPPIEDLEQKIDEIKNEEPASEIKVAETATGECAKVSWELMSLNGQSYCILDQTDFDTFRFAVQGTGDRSIDEISVKMYGQGGDSVVSNIGEVELRKGVTKKLGAFYSSESRGRLWKVELTPKTIGDDGRTMIECTTLTLLIDASALASKEIPYCI